MSLNYEDFFASTFALESDEIVIVLTNPPSNAADRYEMALRWHAGLERLAVKVGATVLPLATYEDTGANGAPLPKFCTLGAETILIDDILSRATLVLALVAHSATGPLLDATRRYPKLRAASLPGILAAMEQTALLANPADLIARNDILRDVLDDAVLAQIEFSTGDSLQIDLRPNVMSNGSAATNVARSDNGYLPPESPGRLINLPSGETWRVPYEETDPHAVDQIPERQSRTGGVLPTLSDSGSAKLIVERGRIVAVEGTGAAANQYREVFATDPVRGNIAEFGLGSNPKAVVRGSILEDEKAGPHIAYGRSDYLGGLIGISQFERPENVLHIDIVFAKSSPIHVKRLMLVSATGSEQLVMVNGDYLVF